VDVGEGDPLDLIPLQQIVRAGASLQSGTKNEHPHRPLHELT
jgi:hypothetical protein